MTPVLAAGLFLLLFAFALILFGLYAGHIPWLREITGAAPLERESTPTTQPIDIPRHTTRRENHL